MWGGNGSSHPPVEPNKPAVLLFFLKNSPII